MENPNSGDLLYANLIDSYYTNKPDKLEKSVSVRNCIVIFYRTDAVEETEGGILNQKKKLNSCLMKI